MGSIRTQIGGSKVHFKSPTCKAHKFTVFYCLFSLNEGKNSITKRQLKTDVFQIM